MPQSQTISILFDGLPRLHRLVWCLVWGTLPCVIPFDIIPLNGTQRDGSQQFSAAMVSV
ncbi:MAG: hypothetical protein AAGE84_16050 [Cyanobacteria bacterium P01_G01_bin.39]